MDEKEEIVRKTQEIKSSMRVSITTMLIGVCFTIFTLVWVFGTSVKFNDLILSQLAISIPFLINSTISYSKLGYKSNHEQWNLFALYTYLTGYALVTNAIGIMIYLVDLFPIAILFFVATWTLEIIYSIIEFSENKDYLVGRVVRASYFISLQVVFGFGVIVIDYIMLS